MHAKPNYFAIDVSPFFRCSTLLELVRELDINSFGLILRPYCGGRNFIRGEGLGFLFDSDGDSGPSAFSCCHGGTCLVVGVVMGIVRD